MFRHREAERRTRSEASRAAARPAYGHGKLRGHLFVSAVRRGVRPRIRLRLLARPPARPGIPSLHSSLDVVSGPSPARDRSGSSPSSARSPGSGESLVHATGGVGAVIVCGTSEPGRVLGWEPDALDVFVSSSGFAMRYVFPPLVIQTACPRLGRSGQNGKADRTIPTRQDRLGSGRDRWLRPTAGRPEDAGGERIRAGDQSAQSRLPRGEGQGSNRTQFQMIPFRVK